MAMTLGAIKRLEIIKAHPEYKEKLWTIVNALQKGLKEAGLDLGKTESPVTPVFMKCPLDQVTQLIYDLRENYRDFLLSCHLSGCSKGCCYASSYSDSFTFP